ncbi:MAG: c-type cytochrome [Leptolyngbyaceae cyanobacterium bins.302]|nr:c-type cytochrome [Leptolyngbyaceae cyanobacterium bins.302]
MSFIFKQLPLESQVASKENVLQRIALVTGAVLVIVLFVIGLGVYQSQGVEPYVREVLALTGDPEQGNAIFQMNCAGCHGSLADGRVGPSLLSVSSRKTKPSLIHQVTSGQTPPMPQFQPSPQEMADLLSYLETL